MEPCSAFVLRRATPACLWQTRRITQQPGRIGQSPLVQSHHLRAPQPAQQMNVMGRDDDSGAEFIQRIKKIQQALRHVGIDEIERASVKERVGKYLSFEVLAVTLPNKKKHHKK